MLIKLQVTAYHHRKTHASFGQGFYLLGKCIHSTQLFAGFREGSVIFLKISSVLSILAISIYGKLYSCMLGNV